MSEFDDPLDLIDEGDGGAVEMSIIEEESKIKKSNNRQNMGCFALFLITSFSLGFAGWITDPRQA